MTIIVFTCLCASFAQGEAAYFIRNADDETILSMAEVRGLDTGLSIQRLRSMLLESVEEGGIDSQVVQEESSYSLEIVHADGMDVTDGGLVMLSGDVEVAFTSQEDGTRRRLMAERMLLDPQAGRLSAYGGVTYEDGEEEGGMGTISADIVTYLYESGDLMVSGGTTTTERTNNEDEEVTFYTTGNLLNYRSQDQGMFFSHGYLTSNPDTAYSSITAENLALLEGGDMFMTNAYLSIGRVPLLYLPAFFYPGSRLVMNPAFGFSSDRGMFVSTTTEVFGTYPGFSEAEESSFASILRSGSDSPMVSNGLYYEEGESESAFARWAMESESYLALLADVYQYSGMLVGFDTLVKPVDMLSIGSNTAFILSPDVPYYDRNLRYYSINEASLSSSFGTIDFSLPLYSDPYVLRSYGNRLTSFSIDSVFGAHQTFPSTYSTTMTSYDALLSGSLRLPSKYTGDLIGSLRLSSIRANASFDWDADEMEYIISDITLPSFTFTMSGHLFRFEHEKDEKTENEAGRPDVGDMFILSDPLLYDMYVLEPRRSALSSSDEWGISLAYSITERFRNDFEIDQSGEEWRSEDQELSSDSSLRLDLEGLMGRWFSFTQSLTPSYRYDYDQSADEERESRFSLLSTTKASIPVAGIEYEFSTYLYRWQEEKTLDSHEKDEIHYRFDRDNVRTHSLSFSKSFGDIDGYGRLTPSLKYTLPPLAGSLEPRLGYRVGPLTTSFSWRFLEDEKDGGYESEDVRFSLALAFDNLTFSFSGLYESADREGGRFIDPFSFDASLSLRTADRRFSYTQYLEWDAFDGGRRDVVESLRSVLSIPYVDFTLNFTTLEDRLEADYFELRVDVDDVDLYAWHNRIHVGLLLDGRLRYDFLNPYSSSLSLKAGLTFSIAEFLDLSLALTTTNNGFYRYLDDEGTFSFPLMWEDLLRSFDFFGEGRSSTQFNMEAFDIELVHYMGDWDLHLRYTASLESIGRDYRWVPTFAVYLRWNTIPDLKVDRTWSSSDGTWRQSDSLYSD